MPTKVRKPTVLLVDDDDGVRFGIRTFLGKRGHEVIEARSCAEALDAFVDPDVVLLDYQLPDGDALGLLERMRARRPSVPIIVLTGHGSIPIAVTAVKRGADEFLTKPVRMEELYELLVRHARPAPVAPTTERVDEPLVGSSPIMRRLREDVERLRDSEASVLLVGETGVGKSLVARRIHELGSRRDRRFVELNCAALTRELVESELFGHERGAFTGAYAAKEGLFEYADEGTLFLDEIGDIDGPVQAKILKVLEEKRFRRVGESRERTTDVRIITATHRDLGARMRSGEFRGDLYYRISTVALRVPPLRERREDIPELSRHLLRSLSSGRALSAPGLSDAALERLLDHDWPGNVRELRNVLERAVLRAPDRLITADDLRFDDLDRDRSVASSPSMRRTLSDIERASIEEALQLEQGRVEAAARRLGVPRSTLYQKIKAYGIDVARARGAPSKGE